MLSCSDVGVFLGGRRLFSDVTLRLPPGRCTALVGGNGAGKTTLLHTLMGLHDPDEGVVSRPRQMRIGWLPQDVVDDVGESHTVLQHVMDGAEHLKELQTRLTSLERRMGEVTGAEQERLLAEYAPLQDQFTSLGGYELDSEAHRVLAGLGFAPDDAGRDTGELSGGWRVRVALARLLLAKPDLLVLDEPTNHLDLETIAWLENTLRELPGALLLVSHDRDFIDATADVIVELAAGTTSEYDVRSGTLAAEEGGFAAFVAMREERLASLRAAKVQQDRRIAEQERFVERFRYKASKARLVQSRIKQLDKVERIELPDQRAVVARFAFPEPARAPRVVAEFAGASVSYGDVPVLDHVDLVLERGRKVALLGPNGAGKTTLLKALIGDVPIVEGEVRLGVNVEVAVVDQHQAEVMDPTNTVLEEFRSALDGQHRSMNHRSMLGAFGFPGDLADRQVVELSGGERTRLGLAKAMASPVQLLLLDEPTNHLDLASRDVLEDAIRAYPGTVVLITHDRHVIRAAADAVVEVDAGRARWFDGTYEELLERRRRAATSDQGGPGPATRRTSPAETTAVGGGQRSRKAGAAAGAPKQLRKDVTRVERDLTAAEEEVAALTAELAEPAVYEDTARVKQLVARHAAAKDRADALFTRWESAQLELESAEAAADVG